MLLKAENLTKNFAGPKGTVQALDGVSLRLEKGDFLAVRGPSGCGKTTLLLTVGGLLGPDEGEVELDGQNPYRMASDQRAGFRAGNIGFVFQQFHLVPYLNVLDNVLTPALAGQAPNLRQRAMELLGLLQLDGRAGHVPAKLSTGERQRTAIARAMLRGPKLLLADEPTGNLDEANARIVLECLADFARRGGAVILASHDDRATTYAGRTLQMAAGKIQGQ